MINICNDYEEMRRSLTEDSIDFQKLEKDLNNGCFLFWQRNQNVSCTKHTRVADIAFYKSMLTGEWFYQIDICRSVVNNEELIDYLQPYLPVTEAKWLFNTYW